MADFRSLTPFGRGGLARSGYDPFAGFRQQMDRLLDDFGVSFPSSQREDGNGFLVPRMDVAETAEGLELTAELPGFAEKDVSLDIHDGILTLKAEHGEEREERGEDKRYHLVERRRGTFLRRLALPFEADPEKASAHLDNGLLKVLVPRHAAESAKPKTIHVGKAKS